MLGGKCPLFQNVVFATGLCWGGCMVPLAMASTTRLALPMPWPLSALNQVEILYPGWTWVLQGFTFAVFVAVVLYIMMGSGQYCRSNELMSHPLNGQDVQIIITGMQQQMRTLSENYVLKMLSVSKMLSCNFRTSRKILVLGHSPTIWPV
jgi:hypothetical protein